MGRYPRGFTLVEVLVVVVIIAILATIVTLGLNGYMAQGRDSQRSSDLTTVSEALEKYYDMNGEYPGCVAMTAPTSEVLQDTLTGVSADSLSDPNDDAENSFICDDIASASGSKYEYEGDGSDTCATGGACLSYTLRYKEEGTGNIIEIKSRRQVSIATSGVPSLSASGTGVTRITASWNMVPNSTGYRLQISTNTSFSAIVHTQVYTNYSAVINTLGYNTTYYLRVQAVSSTGDGAWSSIVSATTNALARPSVSVSTTGYDSLRASWGSVTSATGYTVQVARNSGFSTGLQTFTTSSTSRDLTGLAYDTLHYVRVRAEYNANHGPWSTTVSQSTNGLSAPGSFNVSTASSSQINTSWSSVSGATGYYVQWSTSSGFSSPSGVSLSGTSRSVTGLSAGTTYHLRVRAVWSGNNGPWSTVRNTLTTPSNPTNNSIAAAMSGTNAVGTASASCAQGSPQYRIRTRATNTSTMGSWSSWSSWSSTNTRSRGTAQGYQYGFQMMARCVVSSATSGSVTLGTVATTVRGFNAPGAPSVSASTSGNTTTFTHSSVSCSGNGTAQYRYRRSTESNYGSYSSATTAGSATTTTTNQGYNYGMNWSARCTNMYSTSGYGSEGRATYTRPVSGPGPQSYNGYRQAWDIMYLWVYSSCGPGATLYGVVDVYTHDWSWTPGGYYGWRHQTPLGPTWPDGYKPNDALTGSQSSSGIPSGSRWNVGSSYRCQNSSTGRNSGGNIWRNSGIYTAS